MTMPFRRGVADWLGAALLGEPDHVTLGIGDQRELCRPVRAELGHDDRAAQVGDLGQGLLMSLTRT